MARPVLPNKPTAPGTFKLAENPLIMSKEQENEIIVGVDFFIESSEQPAAVAEKCLKHTGNLFKLITLANRGTQVWPKGSSFTNLVNQYSCRFESIGDAAVTQTDILELYKGLMGDFKICSIEVLNMWNDKKAYSLAQGQ